MAATRGPVPKRTEERRRRNKPEVEVTKAEVAEAEVSVPAADGDWHPIATRWYESLMTSGQSRFFEPSDWAAAQLLADAMTRLLVAEKFSAQHFSAVWSGMTDLLTTEGARRRVRLEIQRGKDPDGTPAGVTAIDDYRTRLGVS